MASSPTPKLHFQVFRGDTLVAQQDLSEQSVTIGRSGAALLRVDDPSVGDLHAVINVEDDGAVQLLDLGTEAGTLHNGAPISSVALKSGEAFQIGGLRVVISFDEREHTTPTMDVRPTAGGHTIIAHDMDDDDEPEDATDVPADEEIHVLDMLHRAGFVSAGQNTKAPKVLEVSHVWADNLLDTKQFKRGANVTIGPSFGHKWTMFGIPLGWVPEYMSVPLSVSPPIWSDVNEVWSSDFYASEVDLPNKDDHILFAAKGNGWAARLDKRWTAYADVADERLDLAGLTARGIAKEAGNFVEIEIRDDMNLVVDIDGVLFFSRLAHPAAAVVVKDEPDIAFLSIASVCGFVGLALSLMVWFSPPSLEAEMNEEAERFVELILDKPPEPPPEEKKEKKNEDAGEGAKAKKEEGSTGKKEAKLEKTKGEKIDKSVQDREIAENAGILGALNDPDNMLSSGLDASLSSGIGGLIGTRGTQFGAGGLGARGGGLGGGGTGDGLGGLGARGSGLGGSGNGKGAGEFGQGGDLGSKGSGTVRANTGEPIILGALDRSLIDQVIKRKMSQIRYCYQRELQKNPTLAGKVTIKFTIAKDGTVSQAGVKSTTLNNAGAEKCITDRFYQMQFPEPKGGGIVVVSYPFIFSPG